MTRVVVCGICGRMGTIVGRALEASTDLEIAGGVELPGHECVGRKLCDVPGGAGSDIRVAGDLDEYGRDDYDVLIDFSSPAQAVACARKAAADARALVVGTTGLSAGDVAVIEEASRTSPIVLAPNTSIGVNVLFELVRSAASSLGPGFDVEIVEAHHRRKKDAPSGTAAKLIRIVADARGVDPTAVARHGRAGLGAERVPDEIGVHSIRAGQIAGRHEIFFVSDLEEVRLSHEARSREAFAAGAVRAARYVHGRSPGLYEMAHVLGLREDGAPK